MAVFIVNTGVAVAIARIKGQRADTTAQPEPVYTGWGTGSPPGTARTDTGLSTEVNNSGGANRPAGTSSIVTSNPGVSPNNDTYQVVTTLTVGSGTGAITVTNAGLFDATTGGNLFLKGDFTGIALSVGDALQLTFRVVGSSA